MTFPKKGILMDEEVDHVTYQKRISMAYISRSKMVVERSFLEGKFLLWKSLMAHVSDPKTLWNDFLKKKFLMAYISNQKEILMAYINRSCD